MNYPKAKSFDSSLVSSKIMGQNPLLLTEERDIKTFVKKASLPVMKSPCPMDKTSERAKMKDMLHAFDREHRGLYTRIVGAVERGGIDGWHE